MAAYVLSCESTVDLTKEYLESRGISYICYPYELDGVPHWDDFGGSVAYDAFYRAMENGADTKTAQISADEFEMYFEPFLQAGMDVVHLCLSSGFGLTAVLDVLFRIAACYFPLLVSAIVFLIVQTRWMPGEAE